MMMPPHKIVLPTPRTPLLGIHFLPLAKRNKNNPRHGTAFSTCVTPELADPTCLYPYEEKKTDSLKQLPPRSTTIEKLVCEGGEVDHIWNFKQAPKSTWMAATQ